MENKEQSIEILNQIHFLMQRSSRFLSLSGLSGIFAGIYALMAAAFVYWYTRIFIQNSDSSLIFKNLDQISEITVLLILVAVLTLVAALSTGYYFTRKRARKKGLSMWDWTARRVFINLFIPLVAGGIFCTTLIYHQQYYLISGSTLLFYGLALINASNYTLNDIRYLGYFEVILGLIAVLISGSGLIFWSLGFGLLHIVYGILMYRKYEKKENDSVIN